MQVVKKTSPVTGIKFNCIKMDNGNLIIDNALLNTTIELRYDMVTDSFMLPAKSLDYIPTCSLLEVSQRLNVSRMRVSRMCASGDLVSTKINGVLVIKSDSVDKWIKEHANGKSDSELATADTD